MKPTGFVFWLTSLHPTLAQYLHTAQQPEAAFISAMNGC
jgi:hypothetical protein